MSKKKDCAGKISKDKQIKNPPMKGRKIAVSSLAEDTSKFPGTSIKMEATFL